MTVELQLYSQSRAMVIRDVENTYTKDGLFCIRIPAGGNGNHSKHPLYLKFPVMHIFRVMEYQEG